MDTVWLLSWVSLFVLCDRSMFGCLIVGCLLIVFFGAGGLLVWVGLAVLMLILIWIMLIVRLNSVAYCAVYLCVID